MDEIAKIANDKKLGARGLRSIVENTMLDIMYEFPIDENIKKVIITKEPVLGKSKPIFENTNNLKQRDLEDKKMKIKYKNKNFFRCSII